VAESSGPSVGPFTGQTAVVTGAGSGIGKAIALSLASQGADLCLVWRRRRALTEVAGCLRERGWAAPAICATDLQRDDELMALVDYLGRDGSHVDILVHAAAVIAVGTIARAPTHDLDRQYRTNVRAPYTLTQALLLTIARRRAGDVPARVELEN
jgi:short-subunit dehydrogenase